MKDLYWDTSPVAREDREQLRAENERLRERVAELEAAAKRRCRVCGELKPLDAFNRDSKGKLGRSSRCRNCQAKQYDPEWRRSYRERNLETEREREREKARERKRQADPARDAVRHRLRNEVAAGRVVKPSTCDDCGKAFPPDDLHGHHEDYGKPLEVDWLCPRCHGLRHRFAALGDTERESKS